MKKWQKRSWGISEDRESRMNVCLSKDVEMSTRDRESEGTKKRQV